MNSIEIPAPPKNPPGWDAVGLHTGNCDCAVCAGNQCIDLDE